MSVLVGVLVWWDGDGGFHEEQRPGMSVCCPASSSSIDSDLGGGMSHTQPGAILKSPLRLNVLRFHEEGCRRADFVSWPLTVKSMSIAAPVA